MNSSESSPEDLFALGNLVAKAFGAATFELEPMKGGASPRRFCRVHLGNSETAVAMFHPEGDQVNELARVSRLAHRFAFVEVRELLERGGVRVPKLFGADFDRGWLLVEDLGRTLAEHLELFPHEREALYQEAVRDLAWAQEKLAALPPESVVSERAFDADLLGWEIDHFREWALEARGIELSASERQVFDSARGAIAGAIASWPRSFVHRDYQSRNLMVCSDAPPRLAWIDFQDALLGPRVYDLVALLGDSYQSFSTEFIERRLSEYAEATEQAPGSVHAAFLLTMAQRKLKDAGRFIYLERRKGKAQFLQFFEPTVGKAKAALASLLELDDELGPRLAPALGPLRTLLERYFPQASS